MPEAWLRHDPLRARRVCGKVGVVTRCDGEYTIPDVEAHSPARPTEQTYSVRFDAEELWHDGQRGVTVNVDLWDSYLGET